MWDEDIPSFIQALTTLDDGSFISTSAASVVKPTQFYCETKEHDTQNDQYNGISSNGSSNGTIQSHNLLVFAVFQNIVPIFMPFLFLKQFFSYFSKK